MKISYPRARCGDGDDSKSREVAPVQLDTQEHASCVYNFRRGYTAC